MMPPRDDSPSWRNFSEYPPRVMVAAPDLVVLVPTASPVFVLLLFLDTPLIQFHVLSVSIVLPLEIAIVLRPALGLAARRNDGSSQ